MASKTVVLVSGANQGIGFEIVRKLATEQPDYHILLGSRDITRGEEAAKSLGSLLGTVEAIQLDVDSDGSINACVSRVTKEFGHLEVLVNNAGIGPNAASSIHDLRGRYAKILGTNVIGAAVLTEACLPLLHKSVSRPPRIVFISSEMGSLQNTLDPSFPYYGLDVPDYKASKAAMNQLAATYAVRLGKAGFKVNSCCPGLRATHFHSENRRRGGDPAEGAVNACRLATLGKDGENGTFSNIDGPMPW